MKNSKGLGFTIADYLIDFVSGTIFTFVALEMFVLVSYVIDASEWVKIVIGLVRLTPGMALNNDGTFFFGLTDIFQIVLVWGLMFFIVNIIFTRLLKIKLLPNTGTLLTLILGLHIAGAGVGVLKTGVESIQTFIMFCAVAIMAFGVYAVVDLAHEYLTEANHLKKKRV